MAGVHSTNDTVSTKAAEIYRKDCGGIYYVCYHCGIDFNNVVDILAHIESHFSSPNTIKIDLEPLDIVDVNNIKYELFDGVSQEVDSSQLEQIFIDCNNKSNVLNEEQCLQMDTSSYTVVPVQQTFTMTIENYSDMEGHFEWKCLYCSNLFKKFTKLKKHLATHIRDSVPSVPHESIESGKDATTKAQYSFKCILCPSEFYDSSSSRQHVKDFHEPQPIKCIPCGRKFVSTQLLKDHMSTVHTEQEFGTNISTVGGNEQVEVNSKALLSQFNTFLCVLCDKTFNGTMNLMHHTFVHFNLKNFSCAQCPAKFQKFASIKDHMMKKHFLNIDEQDYNIQCRFCTKKVDSLFDFVTHTFTHHLDEGDRNNSDLDSIFNYDCRFCFKNFNKWNNSRQHLNTHAKDELPKGLPSALPVLNVRSFSERAKSGMHRSEFLYNCSGCKKTLCGSFEARNHWITEHKKLERNGNVDVSKQTSKTNADKGVLKCYDCDGNFSSQLSLMKHRLMHFKVQPYTCTICSKAFTVSRNATIHMTKIHQAKPDENYTQLDCHYCKAEFTEEVHFITHMFHDHLYVNFNIDENLDGRCKYECLYCKEIITERSLMDDHLLQFHKNEVIPVIDTDTTSIESSVNALRHTPEFMYCCLYCPKKFRLPHPASEHVKYKHKTENNNNRKKEKKPAKETHCNLCNITFLTWRSMLNHRAKRHPETHKKDRYKNRPTYYCSTCGKVYQDRGNLNQHEETHARLQSYTCDICNKTYRTKNYIQTHMLRHRNEKNFVCDQCGRSFYSVSKLNTHSQIHQNLKLNCDQCDKVFFTRYNLSKHKKTHTNDTRKKCKLCDNYFKSSNSFRTHMLLHTGVKKYACRYCDMTFAQSSGRRGHEKLRHHVT